MSVAASEHKTHNLSWSDKGGMNRGGDGSHEEYDSRQAVEEAIRKGVEKALGSIADKSNEVDSASTGEPDGIASQEDIRSALDKGMFDGDMGKTAVEQLLQNPSWLNLYWGRNATDDQGRLAISVTDLDAYRRSGGQSGDDSSRAFDQREDARRAVEEGDASAPGDWTALNLRRTAEGSDPASAMGVAPPSGSSAVSGAAGPTNVSVPARDTRSATSTAPKLSDSSFGSSWSVLPSQRRFEAESVLSSAKGGAPNPMDYATTGAENVLQAVPASSTGGDVVTHPGSTGPNAPEDGGASEAAVPGNGPAPSAAAADLSNSNAGPASGAASGESPALVSNGTAPGSTNSGATTGDTTASGTNDTGPNTQTAGPDTITRLRGAVIDNFGFLDVASSSTTEIQQSRDGKVNRADIAEAARTRMLESGEVQLLSQLAADGSVFDALDLEDGYKDGELVFSSLLKNDTRPSVEQKSDLGLGEVPDVRFAHYSDEFFQIQQHLVTQGDVGRAPDMSMVQGMASGSPSVVDQVRDDKAGFNAFDSLDGTSDGIISGARLPLEGVDAKELVFSQQANDGSGRSVLEAAMSALGDEFKAAPRPELPGDLQNDRAGSYRMALALWDNLPSIAKSDTEAGTYQPITQDQITAAASNPAISAADRVSLQQLASNQEAMDWLSGPGGQSAGGITQQSLASVVTDFNRGNYSGILMAQGAVQNGIPLKTAKFSGAQFPEDMAKEFCAEQVFNPGVTEAAYKRLMADPAIQQALSAKVRQFISNADSAARKLFDEITSPYYIDSLDYLERQSGGQGLSEQKMTTDLAALGTLDSGLAEKASLALLQQKFVREIAEATPSSVPEEELVLATRDALAILSVELRTVRGLARLPGLLLGHDLGWKKMGSLFSGWSPKQWGAVADLMPEVLIKADKASSIGSAGKPSSPTAQSVINAIDATVSEASAQLEGSASVAERTRNQGSFNFLKENASRLKEFVSAAEKHGVWASLAGAISMASGIYKLAKGGNSIGSTPWGRLSIANDFVLAACFTPGYVSLGNFAAGKLGGGFNPASIGLSPNQRFGDLVRASFTGDASIVGTRLGGAVTGMMIKGLTGGSLLAAGAIGGAMGIKQIVDGVRLGENSDVAAGSLNIAMGTAWAASGVTYLMASALTGPLIGIGCLFGIASALVSLFGPRPESQFAKLFEEKVGEFADSGVLREGWRDQVKDWFVTSRSSIPDEEYDGYTGMGMDS